MNAKTCLSRLPFPVWLFCATLLLATGISRPSALAVDTTFTDVSVASGIFENNLAWGAAWGDYDNDGNIDVFTVGHLGSICQLWHNNGDGTFSDVTTAAGMLLANGDSHGPCWADLDNDGDLDLYIAKGTNKDGKPINYNNLWRNNGDGTFTDIAVASHVTGLGDPNRGTTAIDYDNDGDLDLFIPSYFIHDMVEGNLLFRNDGDFVFTDVATEAGVSEGFHERGAAWADYDLDGFIDFFILETHALYHNNGDGTFTDVTRAAFIYRGRSNCASWGDYDNDGDPDLFIAGDHATFLYRNNGNGTFNDVTEASGTRNLYRALSADWGDYDNDGDLDLYVVNALRANLLFRNNGDGTFRETAVSAGVAAKEFGNGSDATFIDYNNDGFLDVFVCNGAGPNPGPYLLFQNNGNTNHWLKIKLVGTQSNPRGVGARITLTAGTTTMHRQVFGQHCMAQNQVPAHFGLRTSNTVSLIAIDWPSGVHQELTDVAADQTIVVTEP